jgi:hypothetical protein
MKLLAPLLALLLLAARSGAQTDVHEDCQRRIHDLEERLAVVESQLTRLLEERSNPTPPVSQPAPPPAPAPITESPANARFTMPPELVPDIGKIGAEVGIIASGATNPFKLDNGAFFGGFIDLPLVDRPSWLHGKISYEILVGLSRSQTKVQSTSNVAQVTNLAVLTALNPNGGLANVGDALSGTGAAPFPVTTENRVNMRLLQVIPFAFKYTSTAFDRWRFRPYGVVGWGTYVTIHNENPISGGGVRADANLSPDILAAISGAFGGKAPFGAPLVAGQISNSPELIARGLPGGNGNLDIGVQFGAGFEWRLTRTLSLGFDGRLNKLSGTNGTFGTYGSRLGFHF